MYQRATPERIRFSPPQQPIISEAFQRKLGNTNVGTQHKSEKYRDMVRDIVDSMKVEESVVDSLLATGLEEGEHNVREIPFAG